MKNNKNQTPSPEQPSKETSSVDSSPQKSSSPKLPFPLLLALGTGILFLGITVTIFNKYFSAPQPSTSPEKPTPTLNIIPTVTPVSKTQTLTINPIIEGWNTYQGKHHNFRQNKDYILIFKYPKNLTIEEPKSASETIKVYGIHNGLDIYLEMGDASSYFPGKLETLIPTENIIINSTKYIKEIFKSRDGYAAMHTSLENNFFINSHHEDYSNLELINQILSTFRFLDEENKEKNVYNDELISFTHPSSWKVSRVYTTSYDYHLAIGPSPAGNLIFVTLISIDNADISLKKYFENSLYVPTNYSGMPYIGYGDYSVIKSDEVDVNIAGLKGTKYIYYQKPENKKVGSINFVFLPIDQKSYYRIEYSGQDKEEINSMIDSLKFK